MEYYLAGGAVRDFLMGETPQDLDFAFQGKAEEFIALNPQARKPSGGPALLIGQREYTPLRGGSIESDLAARDFTINSFLLDQDGILHMHPQALGDLRGKILRPASASAIGDDPLRIFRAARFLAVYPDFSASPDCLEQIRAVVLTPEFRQISAERVGRECMRAMLGPKPGNFLRLLERGEAFSFWFGELSGAGRVPAGPPQFHKTNVLEHIAVVMDKTFGEFQAWRDSRPPCPLRNIREIRTLAMWMALCHDLGKNGTPPEILPHHYEHETRGQKAASSLAKQLRLSERLRQAGMLAAKLHMKAGIYPRLRPSTRVDMLVEAQSSRLIIPLFLLAQADSGCPNLLEMATRDLVLINSVTLPENWRNKGRASGRKLRELRCQALPSKAVPEE